MRIHSKCAFYDLPNIIGCVEPNDLQIILIDLIYVLSLAFYFRFCLGQHGCYFLNAFFHCKVMLC